MKNFDKVFTHSLIQNVLDDFDELKRRKGSKNDDFGLKDISNLTEYDFYINDTSFCLIHLLDLCEILVMSVKLISNFKYDKKNEFNQGDQLTYNIENYIIRLSSLQDRTLQTINSFFYLGIHEKDVNEKVVIDNVKVSTTEIKSIFNELRKTIGNNSSVRNIIIHKHSIMDKQLRRIQMFYHPHYINSISKEEIKIKKFRDLRKEYLKQFITSKKKEYNELNERCFETLLKMFNLLEIQFNKNKQILK